MGTGTYSRYLVPESFVTYFNFDNENILNQDSRSCEEKYASSHAASLKTVADTIAAERDVASALKGVADESAPAAPSSSTVVPGAGPSRTLATPDFDGQPTPNFDRIHEFQATPLDDFKAGHTFLEHS